MFLLRGKFPLDDTEDVYRSNVGKFWEFLRQLDPKTRGGEVYQSNV